MLNDFDIGNIRDMDTARDSIVMLLNHVESVEQENRELKQLIQRLRDENNRLKGEKGKPKIKPNKKNPTASDYSSEKERRKPKLRAKSSKLDRIEIHDTSVLNVPPELLPDDAIFKGYAEVVVQDIIFQAYNILFKKEKYYSPSQGKTFLADLPSGYQGEFGPALKSMAIALYYESNMSEAKILELMRQAPIYISAGQISNILIKNQDNFHQEKDAIYEAGLRSSPWQHMDDTGARVNGQNQYCQILCNPLYTAYFTTVDKSRLTVIDVLRNFRQRTFLFNAETFSYLEAFKLPAKIVEQLKQFPQGEKLNEERFSELLNERLPQLGPLQYKRILESAAISAYHAQMEFPVVRLLICDDAPQFKLVTEELSLCWVHDGRFYKKIDPFIPYHKKILDDFLGRYWEFYHRLLLYKEQPTPEEKAKLGEDFDRLFSTVTGYDALDERIAKTKKKKGCLLMALEHPEIPLHNNPAELGARKRVRKRDVSFGTRTRDGTKAWDTFLTLSATAKKLEISFYKYIHDRIACYNKMPDMAEIITERAKECRLGTSWEPP